MKNLFFISVLLFLVGCKSSTEKCCHPEALVISDIYLAEFESETRFTCISNINGELIESKYLNTEQIHKFQTQNSITQVHFYHTLIQDTYKVDKDTSYIVQKTFDLSFGKLVVSIFALNQEENFSESEYENIIQGIQVSEKVNSKICFECNTVENKVTDELQKIGVVKFTNCKRRQELTIATDNPNQENLIDIMFRNRATIHQYLKDGDIVTFVKNDDHESLFRLYIIVHSASKVEGVWCGLGPKEFAYECIYINNQVTQ